ncbi:MBL fold metallo-hydrolase [Komagataeibacter rhaeticus]|nr:MBL fold metallo-hydrolase [Komagataeibacter rhaeticus]
MAVTFIGHSTFLIRLPRADGTAVTILTDPIFSKRCSPFSFIGPKRVRAPGRRLADLPKVDIVLVSHAHYDHMDLPSLRALARRGDDPLVVTPLENARFMRGTGLKRIMELDWWQGVDADGMHVTCTPARHGAARTPFDRNRSLWGGFMLRDGAGHRLFFAGDTADGRHWGLIRDRLGAPDLALLPIGAYAPAR